MRKHRVLTVLALSISVAIWIQLITAQVRADVVAANLNVDPDALLLKENGYGKWITAYISFREEDYNVSDINMSSLTLEITDIGETISWSWYRIDGNTLVVKFRREDVMNAILWSPMMEHMSPHVKQEITLKVTGNLDNGDVFEGTDRIKVFFTQL